MQKGKEFGKKKEPKIEKSMVPENCDTLKWEKMKKDPMKMSFQVKKCIGVETDLVKVWLKMDK